MSICSSVWRLGISTLDGGDEGADDWLAALPVLELSVSVELVGGDEPNGDGFWGELPCRGRGECLDDAMGSFDGGFKECFELWLSLLSPEDDELDSVDLCSCFFGDGDTVRFMAGEAGAVDGCSFSFFTGKTHSAWHLRRGQPLLPRPSLQFAPMI